MGFFKDAGENIAKYSNIFINKTEEYSHVAKITIEIKKLEKEKGKIEKEMGQYIIETINNGSTQLSAEDETIKTIIAKHSELTIEINDKKNKVEEIKKSEAEKKDSEVSKEVKTEEVKTEEPATGDTDKPAAE